jgi:hypothetical protein
VFGDILNNPSREGCTNVSTTPPPIPFPIPIPTLGCNLGDEEWVNLLPPYQFLTRYVFFTDPSYGTTNLVVTRVRSDEGFHDVTIECLGTVTGWMPVGNEGKYEVAHVDLLRGGIPAGNCTTSRQVAHSNGRFGITVWGTDDFASYGYPAGGNVGTINQVRVVVPIE